MAGRPLRRARLAREARSSSGTGRSTSTYSGKCPWGLELQSLLFPKSEFDPAEASEWLAQYKKKPLHDETANFWRARQREPHEFIPGSLRTIQLGRGQSRVKAIVGCPKQKSPNQRRKWQAA